MGSRVEGLLFRVDRLGVIIQAEEIRAQFEFNDLAWCQSLVTGSVCVATALYAFP